jgi:hypothetical protein
MMGAMTDGEAGAAASGTPGGTPLERLRLSAAEYDAHRSKPAADPDAGWWYEAWAAALVPALREALPVLARTSAGDWPERPVILDGDTEREVLFQRLVSEISRVGRHGLNLEMTVGDGLEAVTAMVVTGALRYLRVMSARQLGVLLGTPADHRSGWLVREPPRYTAEEIDGGGT